jgi:hypothetical protein
MDDRRHVRPYPHDAAATIEEDRRRHGRRKGMMRDGFLSGVVIGVGVGVGLALLAPVLLGNRKQATGAGRPLAKQLIRTGLTTFERGKESLGEFGEMVEDLFAEVKAEMIIEKTRESAAAAGEASAEP